MKKYHSIFPMDGKYFARGISYSATLTEIIKFQTKRTSQNICDRRLFVVVVSPPSGLPTSSGSSIQGNLHIDLGTFDPHLIKKNEYCYVLYFFLVFYLLIFSSLFCKNLYLHDVICVDLKSLLRYVI